MPFSVLGYDVILSSWFSKCLDVLICAKSTEVSLVIFRSCLICTDLIELTNSEQVSTIILTASFYSLIRLP